MTQQHPITPPPDLVKRLCDKAILHAVDGAKRGEVEVWLIQEAFRTGADQELEACCEWLRFVGDLEQQLRAERRPKPPSLKEQALELLEQHAYGWTPAPNDWDLIRRALEEGLDGSA
jgi:hypothetical protein